MARGVIMSGTGLPPREPQATCEACDAIGTVGRAARTDAEGQIVELHRFCARCWPEQSARYRARWDEEERLAREHWHRSGRRAPPPPSRGTAFESATWHVLLELVGTLNDALHPVPPPTAKDLAAIAAEIIARRDEYEGPMPSVIEAFVRTHSARKE